MSSTVEWTVAQARRTQQSRTEATRSALIDAARRLFGAEGYAAIGTEAVVREAGVTRGALYHQFGDKAELFAAVLDAVEADLAQRMVAAVVGLAGDAGGGRVDTATMLLAGADAFLDACAEPAIQRIVLIDGPSVLGWDRWREICLRHSVGLVAGLLADGIARGEVAAQPVDPLTHVLVGAVDEAAIYVSRAADPQRARSEVGAVLRTIARSITAGG